MEFFEYLSVYIIGALGYGALEILWRGYTHYTMLMAGGLCFLIIYLIANYSREGLLKKGIMCAAIITTVEHLTGCIVNIGLGMNVWNYSSLPYNLLGQICLYYSGLWLALSFPAMLLSRILHLVFRRLERNYFI